MEVLDFMENKPKTPTPAPVPETGSVNGNGSVTENQPTPGPGGDVAAQMDALMNSPEANAGTGKDPVKKSKKGKLIAFIVIGLILIGGGVFGVLWFINYQKPENVVLDAITKTIGKKAAKITGDLTFSNAGEDGGVASISIKSSGENGGGILPSSSETTITFAMTGGEKLEIKVGGVFLADGVLYFMIDGLEKAVEPILTGELGPYAELLGEIFEGIDGVWWKFDIEDFGMPKEIASQYDCVVGLLSSFNDSKTKDELVKLYKDWPLLDAKKTDKSENGHDGYEVTLNTTNIAGLINNFNGTSTYKEFTGCVESTGGELGEYMKIDAKDVELPDGMPTLTLFIHPWSHELGSIRIDYGDSDVVVKGSIALEFVDSVNITAPEDAKSIEEMIGIIMLRTCSVLTMGMEMEMDEDDCMMMISEAISGMMQSSGSSYYGDGDWGDYDWDEDWEDLDWSF